MDIKLLVDKWLSNKKKIRGLKDQLRKVQLEARMDEASITKHLVENETEESPTIVSEFHKKEVRIKKYQTEKLFPTKTVERKLIWEELERNNLTKDFIVLNTWKIHKYLRGKFNHAHETFIKAIRDSGLTQKSESIKLEVKDLPPNTNNPPSSLIEDDGSETDADIPELCQGIQGCTNHKIQKDDDKEFQNWINPNYCLSCNEEFEINSPKMCMSVECPNENPRHNFGIYIEDLEEYQDPDLCIECLADAEQKEERFALETLEIETHRDFTWREEED
jgi:hypothetical protein